MRSLHVFLCVVVFFSVASVSAKSDPRHKVDSLLSRLNEASDDTLRVKLYFELSDKYALFDRDSAFHYAKLSVDLGRKIDHKKLLPDLLTNLGVLLAEQQQLPEALKNYLEALRLYKNSSNLTGQGRVNLNIGNTYYYREMYKDAIAYYEEAVRLYLSAGDKDGAADVYMNMGVCQSLLSDNLKAIDYYKQSMQIKKEAGNKKGVASCLQNIGLSYGELKKYPEALNALNEALELRKEIGNKSGMSYTFVSIGGIYNKLKKFAEAEKNFLLAIEAAGEYYKYGNVTLEAYSGLLDLAKLQGNSKTALDYSLKLIEIKDSIHARQKSQDIAEMSERFESEKKELSIQNLNKEKELQAAEIKKQNAQKISFAAGFGLMLVLSLTIFIGYRQKRNANLIISRQKEQVERSREMLEQQKILLEEKNRDITDSINYAKRIQTAILCPPEVIRQTLSDFFILYKPKDIVSGDFYYYAYENGVTVIAVADCTGHGVPGAFMSLIGNDLLNQIIIEKQILEPGEILSKLHDGIRKALKQENEDSQSTDGMDIALCTIDDQKRLKYAGALRNLYLLRKESNAIEEIKADKKSIGGVKSDSEKTFRTHTFDLQAGDTFYINSDGFADQFGGPDGKKFMTRRLKELLSKVASRSMVQQELELDKAFNDWRSGREQVDDVCLIGVRV